MTKIIQINGDNFVEHDMKEWAKKRGYSAEVKVKGKIVEFDLINGVVKDIDGVHPIENYYDNYITDSKGRLDYIMKYRDGKVLERIMN